MIDLNKYTFVENFFNKRMYLINNFVSNISATDYITNYRDVSKFIVFCKQCNKYNNCWACPPYDFDMDGYLSGYESVYIIGTKISLSENVRLKCVEAEISRRTGAGIIADVRHELDKQLLKLESKYPDSKAFFAGTCHLCPDNDCTRIKGQLCRYPDKIRHSLESFGFDIAKTTTDLLHIELKWSNNGLLPEYLTLVSGFFTNYSIDNQDIKECFPHN